MATGILGVGTSISLVLSPLRMKDADHCHSLNMFLKARAGPLLGFGFGASFTGTTFFGTVLAATRYVVDLSKQRRRDVREEDMSIFGLSSSSSEELSEELSDELLDELSEELLELLELSDELFAVLFEPLDSVVTISFWVCSFNLLASALNTGFAFFSDTSSLSDSASVSASDSEKTAVLFSLSTEGSATGLDSGCAFGSSGEVDKESEDESDQPSESNVTWTELSRTGFAGGFSAEGGETDSFSSGSSELDDSSEESLEEDELADIALFSSVIRSSTSRSLSLSILEDVSSIGAVSVGSIEGAMRPLTATGTTPSTEEEITPSIDAETELSALRGPVTTGTVAESIRAIYS